METQPSIYLTPNERGEIAIEEHTGSGFMMIEAEYADQLMRWMENVSSTQIGLCGNIIQDQLPSKSRDLQRNRVDLKLLKKITIYVG